MMLLQPKWMLLILAILCLVAMATAEETKSQEKTEQKQDKEKRSQEDIMFGNQQNKPAGMVDDLLAFPEGHERKSADSKNANKTTMKTEKSQTKQNSLKQHGRNDDEHFDYYDYVPDNSNTQDNGYPLELTDNTRIPISSRLPEPQLYIPREIPDYPSEDFDNALYRRKRKTPRRPLRKRSLRSNLEELLGSHHRLPRRAPRLKRDAGVEQILNWLEMIKHQPQQTDSLTDDSSFGDGNDDAQWAYYYYYDLPKQQQQQLQQQQALGLQQENLDLPPSVLDTLALEAAAEEARNNEDDWRFNLPSYPVRRSSFYPLDYRYTMMPGQKKRAPSRHMGRWGKFMNRRRFGGDGDDDLFALANMLNDGEDQQAMERRRRRSA